MTKREVACWMIAIRMATWECGGDEITDFWYASLEEHPHDNFVGGYYV